MAVKLNDKLWDSNNKLLPDVRKKLIEIVAFFKQSLEVDIDVVDVHLVGSNASYNYTENSDLDVHIIVNFNTQNVVEDALLRAYCDSAKTAFNNKYDIKIHDIPVELYVEDMNTSARSNGIYSLFENDWVKKPTVEEIPETPDIEAEVQQWKSHIDELTNNSSVEEVQKMLDRLYLMRKNSISVDGEYGKGNLIFKQLRNDSYLDKLKDLLTLTQTDELSLECLLTEATRNNLVSKSKQSTKGLQRYKRKSKSRVANSVRQFNAIDMNKLFKYDIFTVDIDVKGETDDYTVRISFGGFLEILREEVEKNNGVFNFRAVSRALSIGFDRDDVYINCNCPDFRYRFSYEATKNGYSPYEFMRKASKGRLNSKTSTDPETRPAKITNPRDELGSSCKHVLLVLSNNSWLLKVTSVIVNYVKYMEQHYQKLYADIIYPAIYGKPYDKDVQLGMDDTTRNYVKTGKKFVGKTLQHDDRDEKGQFTKGNQSGYKFQPTNDKTDMDQVSLDF